MIHVITKAVSEGLIYVYIIAPFVPTTSQQIKIVKLEKGINTETSNIEEIPHTSPLYLMIVLFNLDVSTHVTKSSICLEDCHKK